MLGLFNRLPASFSRASDTASRSRPDAPATSRPDHAGGRPAAGGRLAERESPAAQQERNLPPALAEIAAWRARRAKVVPREAVAMMVVRYMQDEGFEGWHLPEDIDQVTAWLCAERGIEPPSRDLMREAIICVPGVKRQKLRLKQRPELRHILQRLRARGCTEDRAWVYYVPGEAEFKRLPREDEASPVEHRSGAGRAPVEHRSSRMETWDGGGRRPGRVPVQDRVKPETRAVAPPTVEARPQPRRRAA